MGARATRAALDDARIGYGDVGQVAAASSTATRSGQRAPARSA